MMDTFESLNFDIVNHDDNKQRALSTIPNLGSCTSPSGESTKTDYSQEGQVDTIKTNDTMDSSKEKIFYSDVPSLELAESADDAAMDRKRLVQELIFDLEDEENPAEEDEEEHLLRSHTFSRLPPTRPLFREQSSRTVIRGVGAYCISEGGNSEEQEADNVVATTVLSTQQSAPGAYCVNGIGHDDVVDEEEQSLSNSNSDGAIEPMLTLLRRDSSSSLEDLPMPNTTMNDSYNEESRCVPWVPTASLVVEDVPYVTSAEVVRATPQGDDERDMIMKESLKLKGLLKWLGIGVVFLLFLVLALLAFVLLRFMPGHPFHHHPPHRHPPPPYYPPPSGVRGGGSPPYYSQPPFGNSTFRGEYDDEAWSYERHDHWHGEGGKHDNFHDGHNHKRNKGHHDGGGHHGGGHHGDNHHGGKGHY